MKNILLILLIVTGTALRAQTIPDVTLKDVRSDKSISLSDFNSKKAVVVIFTSNICPYSVYYEGRITQLIADFSSKGIQFILINSHKEDKESATEMANKLSTWGLDIPYLADKDQKALGIFKARKSPEAFILKPAGKEFAVYYTGAIDNNPQVASDVKSSYLRDNITNLLQGRPATNGGHPIGCMVK